MPLINGIISSGEKYNYIKYLNFIEKLTNPAIKERDDLRPYLNNAKIPDKGEYSFIPPSRGYETELVKKLYPSGSIPDNFSLSDKFIEEVKSGNLDIKPKANSGWYDYQVYSLEPLIIPEKCPEAKNLEYSDTYKKELTELFKSIFAIMRETHIKQVETYILQCGPMQELNPEVCPKLHIEPLVSYYLRRAQSYNFIHRVLIEYFGKENLQKMHRLTDKKPVEINLDDELTSMENLFYGGASLSAMEIGCKLELPVDYRPDMDKEKAILFMKNWMGNMYKDNDITRDNRMMVPVFYDTDRNMTKVWAFLGYKYSELNISFKKEPEISIYDLNGKEPGKKDVTVKFGADTRVILYPVFAEIYVKNILNREEFRKVCDKYKTRSEILKALQN
jgi:hypothetical protein